jgi:hypothetical protein
MTEKSKDYPPGWDEDRVRRVVAHYDRQSEEEAVAEDEAAFENETLAVVQVPKELVPEVRRIIARYEKRKRASA